MKDYSGQIAWAKGKLLDAINEDDMKKAYRFAIIWKTYVQKSTIQIEQNKDHNLEIEYEN